MRKLLIALAATAALAACESGGGASYGYSVYSDPWYDYDYGFRYGIYDYHRHWDGRRPDHLPDRPDRRPDGPHRPNTLPAFVPGGHDGMMRRPDRPIRAHPGAGAHPRMGGGARMGGGGRRFR